MGNPLFVGALKDVSDAAPRDSRIEGAVRDVEMQRVLEALLVEMKKHTVLLLLLCSSAGVRVPSNIIEEIPT